MYSKYNRKVLPNGLVLLTIPMDSIPSVTVLIMIGAGSRYENKKNSGISHFLEHMAFKGTVKRPSALAIAEEVDGIGGEFNAFTSKDHTGYYIKASTRHFELVVDVLSDMLLSSLFKTEEIEKEKGVIIEEINMYEDTPARKIGDLFEELLYGDAPLGWDIAGSKQTLQTIKRNDFLAYIDSLYSPSNTVVAVAGGIEGKEQQIAGVIERYLGKWKNHGVGTFFRLVDGQHKPAILVKNKKSEQAHLSVGYRAYPYGHKDRYILSALATILGGGMSSRLFIEIREKRGLAYYDRTGSEQFHDVGYLTSQAGVDLRRIEEGIKVIIEEYEGIASGTKSVTVDELKRAKENMKGRFILELEDSRSVAGLYAGDEILERQIRTPKELLAEIDKVSLEDIARVAKDLFKRESLNLAVIGPFEDKEKFEKIIK